MPIQRDDPYGAFNFQVEFPDIGIDGASARGGFSDVSGLHAEVEAIEYRNGNERTLATRKLPGLARYTDVTLRRGVIGDLTLWNWFKQSLQGQPQRATGRIHLLNESHDAIVMSWQLRDAWPIRFSGPSLSGKTSDIAVDEIVLAHGGIEIID